MRGMTVFRPVSFVALLALAACSVLAQEPELPPEETVVEENPLFALYKELDEFYMAGETNALCRRLEAAIEDPAFAEVRPNLFENYLVFLLRTEQIEDAKKVFLSTMRTDFELARPCSGYVYGYLADTGRTAEALDWVRTLLAQEIPDDFRMAATEWLASGLLGTGDAEGALAVVLDGLAKFPAETFAPIAVRLGDSFLSQPGASATQEGSPAMRLADALAAAAERDAGYGSAEAGLRLRLMAAAGDFARIAETLPSFSERLPDGAFVTALNAVLRAAERGGHAEAIDPIVSVAVLDERFAGLPAVRRLCAREWIRSVFRDPALGPSAFAGRMDQLLRAGIPADQLLGLYTRFFYDLAADVEALRAAQPIEAAIRARLSDPSDLESLRTYDLDAAFLLDDYDRALALVEQGIPDHDSDWHRMMSSKLVAHRAMSKGEWAAAAAAFEEFLSLLPDEDQVDPTTDITYSRAALCANNHRRIGDLWMKAGDRDKARAAYEAARSEYAQAIENNSAGPATGDYLAAQAADLEKAAAALNP